VSIFNFIEDLKMKKITNKMEKESVEKELSQLMELTLRLEDELNCIDYK